MKESQDSPKSLMKKTSIISLIEIQKQKKKHQENNFVTAVQENTPGKSFASSQTCSEMFSRIPLKPKKLSIQKNLVQINF